MLKLSRKVEYAVLALVDIDREGDNRLVRAKDIARRNALPPDLLGRILHRMARCGLVQSVQGANGGFRLRRPLERIALKEVVESVEGPFQLTCCQSDPGTCRQFQDCRIRRPVLRVQADIARYMQKLSLACFRDFKKLPRPRAAAKSARREQ